jgi:hypothetical protein
MSNALEARLTRPEAKSDQASRKFIVVANEVERNALGRAGGIPAGAVVIITGVPRSKCFAQGLIVRNELAEVS